MVAGAAGVVAMHVAMMRVASTVMGQTLMETGLASAQAAAAGRSLAGSHALARAAQSALQMTNATTVMSGTALVVARFAAVKSENFSRQKSHVKALPVATSVSRVAASVSRVTARMATEAKE